MHEIFAFFGKASIIFLPFLVLVVCFPLFLGFDSPFLSPLKRRNSSSLLFFVVFSYTNPFHLDLHKKNHHKKGPPEV